MDRKISTGSARPYYRRSWRLSETQSTTRWGCAFTIFLSRRKKYCGNWVGLALHQRNRSSSRRLRLRMKQIVKLKVNGVEEEKAVHTHHTLLEVLRAEFKLFGAREGCGIGMCGACTVLLDGKPTSSCLLLAPLAEGKEILTIEGLADHGKLHPIQEAFIHHNAFQCAYCTPG